MLKEFSADLAAAKEAERLTQMYFMVLSDKYKFTNVSENPEYYYKGDILATDSSGRRIGIEVKDDKRIAETGNVLCEDQVWYRERDYYGKGNMQSDYDIYCVVSQQNKKIYVLNFKVLKKIYKSFGIYKEITHLNQTTYCYLLPLWVIKQEGGFIAEVDYGGEGPIAKIYNRLEEEANEIARRLESNRQWNLHMNEIEATFNKWYAALR